MVTTLNLKLQYIYCIYICVYVCVCVLKTRNVCSKYYIEFLLHKLTLNHLGFDSNAQLIISYQSNTYCIYCLLKMISMFKKVRGVKYLYKYFS